MEHHLVYPKINDINLTASYSLADFAVSAKYPEMALKIHFSESEIYRCYCLAVILEAIKKEFKTIPIITSGKRSPELNLKVNGSKTSAHLFKYSSGAVDFAILDKKTLEKTYNFILNEMSYQFGQLIYYPKRGIIHLSLPQITPLCKKSNWGDAWIIDNDY